MIKNSKITLSVDCMGGDNSVDDIVGGVKQFCSENINDTLHCYIGQWTLNITQALYTMQRHWRDIANH